MRATLRTTRESSRVTHPDTWWFCFYSVTFMLRRAEQLSPVFFAISFRSRRCGGSLTAARGIGRQPLRPLGGYRRRLGGVRVLRHAFAIAVAYVALAPDLAHGGRPRDDGHDGRHICLGLAASDLQLVPSAFNEIGALPAYGAIGGVMTCSPPCPARSAGDRRPPALVALGVIAAAGGLSLRSLQSPTRDGSWRLPSLAGADDF